MEPVGIWLGKNLNLWEHASPSRTLEHVVHFPARSPTVENALGADRNVVAHEHTTLGRGLICLDMPGVPARELAHDSFPPPDSEWVTSSDSRRAGPCGKRYCLRAATVSSRAVMSAWTR